MDGRRDRGRAARRDQERARHVGHVAHADRQNIVTASRTGFEKKLEISGVGYRAQVQGKNLQLALGYSHDVVYPDPGGHHDRDAASRPRSWSPASTSRRSARWPPRSALSRPPEPYKGKGVKYAGENIFRKEGKKK